MGTGEARTTEEAQKPEETLKPGEAGTQEVCRKVCLEVSLGVCRRKVGLEASRKPTQEIPQ
jgi:hypothetical protein